MTIFVSIAAYRDPELGPTLEDCLARARYPKDLRFGICWQHGPEERPLRFGHDARFRIVDVDWQDSHGVCWARAEVMRRFEGEDFFLQLDSHHRFVEHWDARLLAQVERTASPRPLLTAYAAPYSPGDRDLVVTDPLQLNFDCFTPEGIILVRSAAIPDWKDRPGPVRARFLSAHFLFAPGRFVDDVPYDPELYFHGEEITLAVRAFTHGYDLFHPIEHMLWHEYTRTYRPHKHWTDHRRENGVSVTWQERDTASKARVGRLLREPFVGRHGCGAARSVADYEAYAGVSFERLCVQDYTRHALEPPNPPRPADWAGRVRRYDIRMAVDPAILPPGAERARLWSVAFQDASDAQIDRHDLQEHEVRGLLAAAGHGPISLRAVFESERAPASWTVWPYSADGSWLDRIRGEVAISAETVTLVTALVDIGRGEMAGPFARSFTEDYLPAFERLLAVELPMVVYVAPDLEPLIWQYRRRETTKVVHLQPGDLTRYPHFARIQEIRARPDWVGQAAWLGDSPQARLPLYNPLVFSKMLWLRDVAQEDPFRTTCAFWVDAGICRTVPAERLRDPGLPARLVAAAQDLLFVGYPYRGTEVHGFPRAALERFASARSVPYVVRGGFFGGRVDAIPHVAALYEAILAETLDAGYMGTEESVLTIVSHRDASLAPRHLVAEDGQLTPFFAAPGGSAPPGQTDAPVPRARKEHERPMPRVRRAQGTAALYVLSFNAPAQFQRWIEAAEYADPTVLERPGRWLLNNSTDPGTFAAYDTLCARYGFQQQRAGNLGIGIGRMWCARHFHEATTADAMLYFEDDMLLNGEAGVCVNGFPTHVSALFERTLDILQNEPELDFLKLSFTEHFGDHRFNWAYYNLDREQQRRYFPNGHETHVTAIRSRSGLAYTVGEIYYSNWPMLVSRRGNETLFLQDADVDPREPYLMVRALELARAGTLRSAVLLASPITHYRAEPYAGIERRE